MAKKKKVKKAKPRTKAKQKVSGAYKPARAKKFRVVKRQLIFFTVLFIISLVLYVASSNELYVNLFWMLSFVFGFVAIAFLIILIAFLIMRGMKK